jgi:hypothetical protein
VTGYSVGKFLHVAFNWSGAPKMKELEPTFNEFADWMRYAPNCWIVWTGLTPTEVHNELVNSITVGDRLFICEINLSDRQGWMDKWAWEWFRRTRTPPAPGT